MKSSGRTSGLILLVVAALIVATAAFLCRAYSFLSPNQPLCDADILVVEGWLPEPALDAAASEFHDGAYKMLVTTGFPYKKGVLLGVEGSLVFDIPSSPTRGSATNLQVTASGTEADGEFAHFRVYSDTSLVGETYTSRNPETYTYPLADTVRPRRISLEFDNDRVSGREDRNLSVLAVTLGNKVLHANDSSVVFYYKNTEQYGSSKRMASGTAHDAKRYLERYISPDSVVALETNWKHKSKTYTTALDVKKWLSKHVPAEKWKFNVYSKGLHSRRTWISYRKAFAGSAQIGILNYTDPHDVTTHWWKSLLGWRLVIRESLGLLYISMLN